MKKIFVLYTGGTIGMVDSGIGLRPDENSLNQALLPFQDLMQFDWHTYQPLIDSSALSLEHWQNWLDILSQRLPFYDGALILHGTDTLAYSANFFALTLGHLAKPIMLTGSQRPFNAADSDAPSNLQTAIEALNICSTGVWLAFANQIYPAIGSNKISTECDDGFDNAHFGGFPPKKLPAFDTGLSELPINARLADSLNIPVITLTPAQSLNQIADYLENAKIDGLIIQSYGHGNAPHHADFLAVIQNLSAKVPVINISQAHEGCASAVYAQGEGLRQAGVINAGKCNLETATALLTIAISNAWNVAQIQKALQSLRLI